MAVIIGVSQPWIVGKILSKVKEKDPDLYKELTGGTDDKTQMIPWKKKVFVDSTGAHHIDTHDDLTVVIEDKTEPR